jgi:hypothetical protein
MTSVVAIRKVLIRSMASRDENSLREAEV